MNGSTNNLLLKYLPQFVKNQTSDHRVKQKHADKQNIY